MNNELLIRWRGDCVHIVRKSKLTPLGEIFFLYCRAKVIRSDDNIRNGLRIYTNNTDRFENLCTNCQDGLYISYENKLKRKVEKEARQKEVIFHFIATEVDSDYTKE